MTALEEAWKAGLFQRKHFLSNLAAGVLVGVVALPLAMAFAIASGAKPEQGLYTAIVAGMVVSLVGGTRVQIAGPTGAFIVILAGVTAKYGIDGLQLATLMAGLILLVMGLVRMGNIIKFIPQPVIVGFTSGIAVTIWVGQWKDFLGLAVNLNGHFHEKVWRLVNALPHFHPATAGLALLSLALVLVWAKIPKAGKLPAPLVAMLAATVLQSVFHFPGVATLGSAFGGIPHGLPSFGFPEISVPRMIELIGPAFTIAMLGAIESLLSAVVADGMTGTRHHSNQELIGQGVANIMTPLFGGFAATGAIARTATNIRHGGNSPLAGVIHSATLLVIILALAPLAANVPLCALAAILFVVAYNMSEMNHFWHITRHAPRSDIGVLWITFLLTVFTDLVVAVNIGVILATLNFLHRMSLAVEVQHMSEEELRPELAEQGLPPIPPDVLVYSIEGPFFFGAVESLERALAHTHTDPKTLIIRLRHVPFMDITGLETLEEAIGKLHKRNVSVMLCEANTRVQFQLSKAGLLKTNGAGNYHEHLAEALSGCITNHRP